VGVLRGWEKYGKNIKTFGYGMYSKIIMLTAQKLGIKRVLAA